LDSQPSVVVESDRGSDHEFVMVPGEVIRRRGSILKNPNAPVSDWSVLFTGNNSFSIKPRISYVDLTTFHS